MYSILINDDFGINRDEFMERLLKAGIETRAFFLPMHHQPVFKKMGLFKGENYPIADYISARGLYLPSSSN